MCWKRRPLNAENAPVAERGSEFNSPLETREPERSHGAPVAAIIVKRTRRSKCKVVECGRRLRSKYESRCGLCVHHLRCAELLRDGVPSRFCQKCQKFQPVAEFEGDRKSCIEGLLRHNENQRAARAAREAAADAADPARRPPSRDKPSPTSTSDAYSVQTVAAAAGSAATVLQAPLSAHWATAPLLSLQTLKCTECIDPGSPHSAQSPVQAAVMASSCGAPTPAPLELDAFIREMMRDPECDCSVWWSVHSPASMPPVLALPTVE